MISERQNPRPASPGDTSRPRHKVDYA